MNVQMEPGIRDVMRSLADSRALRGRIEKEPEALDLRVALVLALMRGYLPTSRSAELLIARLRGGLTDAADRLGADGLDALAARLDVWAEENAR